MCLLWMVHYKKLIRFFGGLLLITITCYECDTRVVFVRTGQEGKGGTNICQGAGYEGCVFLTNDERKPQS